MKLALSGLNDAQIDAEMQAAAKEEAAEQVRRAGHPCPRDERARAASQPLVLCFHCHAETLDVGGVWAHCGDDGKPHPFHLYSMKQAIEEGFILDVLQEYTIFETYFKLVKSIEDDPLYKASKANPALAGIAYWNPQHVEEGGHHRRAFQGARGWRFGLPGQGHGGGEFAFDGLPVFPGDPSVHRRPRMTNIPVLVAFSGTIQDGADEWTEAKLNGFPESQTAEKFDKEGYRILIAANKFQTGFDQPKLEAIYVDKVLSGVAAVQTLSRLNRCYPGKRTCVVDFTNEASTIQASFSDYYGAATIDSVTDPNVVYDLKTRLDSFDVYREKLTR